MCATLIKSPILIACEVKIRQKKSPKSPSKGRRRRKLKKWMKIEEEVKGEQGLAALALGKLEEVYEI